MEKVGGDFFSFLARDDLATGCFIGDVSGHGIASALFIALLKSETDRMFRKHGDHPALYLEKLNSELIDYMSSYFITAIYGCFSPAGDDGAMKFIFANGGHPRPVIMKKDGAIALGGEVNLIIGISDTVNFIENEIALEPGDRVFLYTDGIPETTDTRKEMIGFDEGLLALFHKAHRPSLSDTLDAVFEEIYRFSGSKIISDDITLIGFEVK
jgi:sigma-B regulation protein RsbU (phosphoserine phosphatase)